MVRKGQAALEFLTTYGWAFLVVLVMIGALAYFGVFKTSNFATETCTLSTPLECEAVAYDGKDIVLSLGNSLNEKITITEVKFTERKSSTSCLATTITTNTINGYGKETVLSAGALDCSAVSAVEGEAYVFDIAVEYEPSDNPGFIKLSTGQATIRATGDSPSP